MKKLFLIAAIQLVCGITFSQEPIPDPQPTPEPTQPEINRIVEEEAQFPGGKPAMMMFMAENLRYPQTAVEQDLQGRCFVEFIVLETGELTNAKVKKGVTDCPECDKEAIRLVRSMPKWIPGKNNGKAVKSFYTLPVTFKLN